MHRYLTLSRACILLLHSLNVISVCLHVSILHPYVQFVCVARPSLSDGGRNNSVTEPL